MKKRLNNQAKRKRQKGFTLIELVLVIAVLGILSIGVAGVINPVVDFMSTKNFTEGSANEARLAVARMKRDISQIRDVSSVITANATTFSFTNTANQVITFDLNSTNLRRNTVTLAPNITALGFTYWDLSNTVVATPTVSPNDTNILRIQVSVTVTLGSETTTYSTQIRPRNLFYAG